MNLQTVRIALSRMNNNNFRNKGYLCEPISVIAAEALVGGQTPALGEALTSHHSPCSSSAQLNKPMVLTLPPDDPNNHTGNSRAYQVWTWLKARPQRSVFVFASVEDHCYNFVVDGGIFLIDASTQFYRKVGTPGGASLYRSIPKYPYPPGFTNDNEGDYPPSNDQYGFNYLSPQPLETKDNLDIYYWGQLHQNWW